jgi:hypothetical protein
MIIKRFFKVVNSNEIVIFNVNFKLKYEKFKVFVTFNKNLYTGTVKSGNFVRVFEQNRNLLEIYCTCVIFFFDRKLHMIGD